MLLTLLLIPLIHIAHAKTCRDAFEKCVVESPVHPVIPPKRTQLFQFCEDMRIYYAPCIYKQMGFTFQDNGSLFSRAKVFRECHANMGNVTQIAGTAHPVDEDGYELSPVAFEADARTLLRHFNTFCLYKDLVDGINPLKFETLRRECVTKNPIKENCWYTRREVYGHSKTSYFHALQKSSSLPSTSSSSTVYSAIAALLIILLN